MEIFPWPTSKACRLKRAPRTLENKFGGGYTQRIKDGLNNNLQAYSVTFPSLSKETMNVLDAFLGARAGAEAFVWTAPHEDVARKWVCKTWEAAPDGLVLWDLSADFEEVTA